MTAVCVTPSSVVTAGEEAVSCGGGCSSYETVVVRKSRGRKANLQNFSLVGAGAGCGTGAHVAACGSGNKDVTDTRVNRIRVTTRKVNVALAETARQKLLCDVNIIPTCLNRHDLPAAPVGTYVTRYPYITTYRFVVSLGLFNLMLIHCSMRAQQDIFSEVTCPKTH
jgi:hypothetical protein